MPPDRQTEMGRGCRLQSDLAARRQMGRGLSFQTHRQTGRGPVRHCAETAYLETIRADGSHGQAVPIRHSTILSRVYWEQFALLVSICSPKPPVTKAQIIIPSTSYEVAANDIVFQTCI